MASTQKMNMQSTQNDQQQKGMTRHDTGGYVTKAVILGMDK